MLLRTSLAAFALFAAAVTVAAAQQATSPLGPRAGVAVSAPQATVQRATTSISCPQSNGTTITYVLSVRDGVCQSVNLGNLIGTPGRANNASCSSTRYGDEASATCTGGCGKTTGNGSCTPA